jgi:DnaJ-class molecular chaperone
MSAPRPIAICPDCKGEGWVIEEGPDYEGRDGNCWRDVIVNEPCDRCNGLGIVFEEDL